MAQSSRPFFSLYSHGFARATVCIPNLQVASPAFNVERTIELARQASVAGASLALFPELGISAYTCDDLFQQDALLDAVLDAVGRLVEESRNLLPLLLVGAPLRLEGALYNCAVAIHRGGILGIVPKRYLPNYREFYERRQFTPGSAAPCDRVTILGTEVPFGTDLLFAATDVPNLVIHAEICEDVWTPIPPSTYAALGGATVLCNLSASNITVGKAEYRKALCAGQSGKCIAAYLYAAAGPGESTTDLAWDGHALIYENNDLIAESERFADHEQMVIGDIDLDRVAQERMRMTSFQDLAGEYAERIGELRRIPFVLDPPTGEVPLQRTIERFPYVPSNTAVRDERCFEAYNIQVQGLAKRLRASGIEKIVIGVSGGLDSTQALIVAARAMDRLKLPRTNILAYTMPGFATSDKTHRNAWDLMRALGVSANEIDIRPSSLQMLKDIAHPFANGEPIYDITFENVQAGERTSHLFRIANLHNALVLGTGDLSESALGWSTYGVGDHMSHYNVNTSVPKTLIQHLIGWIIATSQYDAGTSATLQSILETEISPELVPGIEGEDPGQSTQKKIGPYELQDFNLYFLSRYGFRPSKVAYLSYHAWHDRTRGAWPDTIAEAKRNEYDLPTIKRWLELFLFRFFQTSQFKRSCQPNGPKVGSGGSLSPRGDWRAPSDAVADAWLEELRRNVP